MADLATVTITRTLLSLSALSIGSEGFSTYYIDRDGLGRVGKTPRETFADDSGWVNGRLRTAVVREESALPLTVRVQAASSSALDTAIDALDAALDQFVYDVTVTVDGVAKTYRGYPATMQTTDALINVERVRDFCEDFTISIPVYPVPLTDDSSSSSSSSGGA